jgi:hypothetical protein
MTNQPINHGEFEGSFNPFTGDFLEAILQEECPYPWNPADPETEAYFDRLEQQFSCLDSSDSDELISQSEALFTQLHQCWTSATSPTATVKQFLTERFGKLVPFSWLEAIAEQAQQVVAATTHSSPMHQLVECVKPLLSNWVEEDLQILARPLVYAMRGETISVREEQWDKLSEIDQVRLTLAIAQEALMQWQAESSK